MAFEYFSSSVQEIIPPASDGAVIAGSGTAFGNSAFGQLTASTSGAKVLLGVAMVPNTDPTEFEIDVAVGGAGSETVIGTICGADGADFGSGGDGQDYLLFPLPIAAIPNASRLSVRFRKTGTHTGSWFFSAVVAPAPLDASAPSITTNRMKCLPTGAAGVSVNPAAGWGNTGWSQITAATADAWALAGMSIRPSSLWEEVEIDVGTGGAGAEVVVTTFRLDSTSNGNHHVWLPLRPLLDNIGSGVRVAIRARAKGSASQPGPVRLAYYEKTGLGSVSNALSSKPLKWFPAAASRLAVNKNASAWVNGSYVQFTAAAAADLYLSHLNCHSNSNADVELDAAQGGAGSEVVQATFRPPGATHDSSNAPHAIFPWPIPIRICASGQRLALRTRGNGGNTSIGAAIGYYEGAPALSTTASHACIPAAAVGVTITRNTSADYANSSWAQVTAGLGQPIQVGSVVPAFPVGAFAGLEIDIGTGGAGSETVRASLKNWDGGWPAYVPLTFPIDVPASTRIALRMRTKYYSSSTITAALNYYIDAAAVPPDVVTLPATSIVYVTARLNGTVDPNGVQAYGRFRWDTVSPPVAHETSPQDVGAGTAAVAFHEDLAGLAPDTVYYFQAVANGGSLPDYEGAILSFHTLTEVAFADGSASHPLGWQEFTDRAGTLRPFAEVDLNDPATYYGGYKAPTILEFLRITRGLSDKNGNGEHLSFGARHDDKGHFWRGLLADPTLQYLTNRPLVERLIDDEDRRLQGLPRLVANGFVSDYTTLPNLEFRISGTDWLKKKFSRAKRAQFAWQPRIPLADFPSCPPETIDTPAPVIYGTVADDINGNVATGAVQIPITTGVPGGYYPYSLGLDVPEMGGSGDTDSSPLIDPGHRSFGVLPGTVPTAPTLAAASGGSLPQSRNDSWTIQVTALHGAVESDPSPMVQRNLDWFGGQRSLDVGWTAASGGATGGYNVYLTNNPFGVGTKFSTYAAPFAIPSDYVQIYHVASGVTSLHISDLGAGTPYTFERISLYQVSAILADGSESLPSGIILGMAHPYARPLHLRWLPFTGAIGYRIRRAAWAGVGVAPAWDTQFDVSSTGATGAQTIDGITQYEFFDDFTAAPPGTTSVATGTGLPPPSGVITPIYVGPMTIGGVAASWFLIARHACKTAVRSAYTNGAFLAESEYGVRVWAPGHAGWPLGTAYVPINGTRYTLIGAAEAIAQGAIDGSAPLTVNTDGIETIGDGTGTLITRIARQLEHFCLNYLAAEPISVGDWLASSPAFEAIPALPLLDADTFDAVDLATEARLADASPALAAGTGYEGAGVIGANGEAVDAESVLGRFAVSGDLEWGFNRKGQLGIYSEPIEAPADPVLVDDVINVIDGSLSIGDRVTTDFFNVLPYVHTRDYSGRIRGGWFSAVLGEVEISDPTSVANYDQEIATNQVELHFGWTFTEAGAATIADVLARQLRRFKNPRRVIDLILPLSGTSLEAGDAFQLSTLEGLGAAGWAGHLVRAIRHEIDIDKGQVRLSCYDLAPILEA